MGTKTIYTCDICGSERKQTNHWFEFYENGDGAIGLRTFKGNDTLKHVCGQACAHQMLDRWLSTGSLEKPEVQNSEPEPLRMPQDDPIEVRESEYPF